VGISVLVVDDDPDVLPIAATILTRLGYQAIAASSGRTALELLEDNPSIGLLMTDLAMPGMDGLELAEHARALRPDLKIMYTSGYAAAAQGNPALRYGPFIAKPWRVDDLRAQLSLLMGSQPN
jgi:CheY-like chemotaxis protein